MPIFQAFYEDFSWIFLKSFSPFHQTFLPASLRMSFLSHEYTFYLTSTLNAHMCMMHSLIHFSLYFFVLIFVSQVSLFRCI